MHDFVIMAGTVTLIRIIAEFSSGYRPSLQRLFDLVTILVLCGLLWSSK
jgi:hypothetical protein